MTDTQEPPPHMIRIDPAILYARPFYNGRAPVDRTSAFLWIVANAAWKDGITRSGRKGTVTLRRGQAALTVGEMAGWFKWSHQTLRAFLGDLDDYDYIRIHDEVHVTEFLLIEIVAYDSLYAIEGTAPTHYPPFVDWQANRRSLRPAKDALREAVLAKSKGGCFYCGYPLTGEYAFDPYHIDHKLPRARGGTDAFRNLVAACQSCNASKGAKSVSQFADDSFPDGFPEWSTAADQVAIRGQD